jgi:hypothetical protein
VEKAIKISKQHNDSPLTLKQYKVKINCDLSVDASFHNKELNIARPRNEIWKELSAVNKQKIEESQKLNLQFEYPSDQIDVFYRMLLKHHQRRGIPCVNRNWVRDLIAFKMYSLALLKKDDKIIAGTLVKEFKDTISFPFTSIAEGKDEKSSYAYALYWKLLEHFSANGKSIFHSGRIPFTDQADDYRLGWGGTKHQYYYQYHPNTDTKTEYASKRGWKRDVMQQCWKRLPVSIAGFLGPHVVKLFP